METNLKALPCLVKSQDGKPALLYVDSFDDDHAAIKPTRESYTKPLWFPRESVFVADNDLFAQLEDAYRRNDKESLFSLWGRAQLWQPSSHEN